MNPKNSRRIKDFLIFIGFGLLAMMAVAVLALLYALIGWGCIISDAATNSAHAKEQTHSDLIYTFPSYLTHFNLQTPGIFATVKPARCQ